MQAFPKDSLNNALGGGGPLNTRPDHSTFLGNNDAEAFTDYSAGGIGSQGYEPYGNGAVRPGGQSRVESHLVNPLARVEPIHGEETLGLGTSTFLEGAPASRTAIQRRESEQTTPAEEGLGRKKSLAQKIRGISNNRRDYGPPGRVTSHEGLYATSPDPPAYTPGGSLAGVTESNPFDSQFNSNKDKKEESITIVEPENKPGRPRAPSSPRRGFGPTLERRATSDGSSSGDQLAKPIGGFLSRVKSLKSGPKKIRPERAEALPQFQAL